MPDIFKMEQAFELVKTIGTSTTELKYGNLQSYDELFGAIQYSLQLEALLAAARIYDIPSKKYPTRCLRGILQLLSENTTELPQIREPHQLVLHLKYMNAPNELITIGECGGENFALALSAYFDFLLNQPDRLIALEKLKLIRDKAIAHNEKRDNKLLGPTWISLKDLIEVSKNFVGVLGWAYFSTAYVIDGEYILSSDALRASNSLKRLLMSILDK